MACGDTLRSSVHRLPRADLREEEHRRKVICYLNLSHKKIVTFEKKILFMELHILLPDENSAKAAIHLKDFIDSSYINGVEKTEVNRLSPVAGEMSAGNLLGSITMIIQAAQKPLVELIKCLQKYVDIYTTTVTIPTEHGPIKLKHGRSMSAKELEELVVAIQKNSTNKT